jgi:hypothetical protein
MKSALARPSAPGRERRLSTASRKSRQPVQPPLKPAAHKLSLAIASGNPTELNSSIEEMTALRLMVLAWPA